MPRITDHAAQPLITALNATTAHHALSTGKQRALRAEIYDPELQPDPPYLVLEERIVEASTASLPARPSVDPLSDPELLDLLDATLRAEMHAQPLVHIGAHYEYVDGNPFLQDLVFLEDCGDPPPARMRPPTGGT